MKVTCMTCCVTCLVVVSCQILATLAAPVHNRNKRTAQTGNERRMSLLVNSELADEPDLTNWFGDLAAESHKRSKRHAVHDHHDDRHRVDLTLPDEGEVSSSVRRHRRSAAFWLHASIQLCQSYPQYCRSIEVEEGDVRVSIVVADQ